MMEIQHTKRATGLIWPDLIPGILEKRYKRFMADATLPLRNAAIFSIIEIMQ